MQYVDRIKKSIISKFQIHIEFEMMNESEELLDQEQKRVYSLSLKP